MLKILSDYANHDDVFLDSCHKLICIPDDFALQPQPQGEDLDIES